MLSEGLLPPFPQTSSIFALSGEERAREGRSGEAIMGRSVVERFAVTLLTVGSFILVITDTQTASAQAKRLGLMMPSTCPTPEKRLMLGPLAAKGWVEGKNLIVDCVVGGNKLDKANELAAELVGRRPDVLAVSATPLVRALMAATTTIPIVMFEAADPVREGLVASLSRPNGNVTGFASMGIELFGKRIETLSELAGRPKRLAVISRRGGDPAYLAAMAQEADAAARALGFEWKDFKAGSAIDYESIFAEIAPEKFDAVYIVPLRLIVRASTD